MKAIDVEEFAQICLDIEKDQKEQGNYTNALFISELRKMISTFPAVDAVPVKHGRWTEQHVDYASDYAIDEIQELKCSACGLYHTTTYMFKITHYKFCPNCGAKMDLEEDQ